MGFKWKTNTPILQWSPDIKKKKPPVKQWVHKNSKT